MSVAPVTITPPDLAWADKTYRKQVGWDSAYDVASAYLSRHWGAPRAMTRAVVIPLQVWNAPFYRYGRLSEDELLA